MNLALHARSNELMRAALDSEIGLYDRETELPAMIAELDPSDDALVERRLGGALLVLAGEPKPAGRSRSAQG